MTQRITGIESSKSLVDKLCYTISNLKVIGLDVGKARIGVAFGIFGTEWNIFPHSTVQVYALEQAATDIAQIIANENMNKVYIGMPISDDGSPSNSAGFIRKFAHILSQELSHTPQPPELEFTDERYTTKIAHNALHAIGQQPSRRRDIVDQIAACEILKTALNS